MNYRKRKKFLTQKLAVYAEAAVYNPLNMVAASDYAFYLFQLRVLKNMKRAENERKKSKTKAKTA